MSDAAESGTAAGSTAADPPGTTEQTPLPRNVKVLSAVSMAQDTGSEMLYPLLPSFITGVLGAPVVALAVAEGLADATSAVMRLVAGRLTTRGRRRPWIAAGYGLAALGKLVVAVSVVWPLAVIGRVVDRFGKGIRGVPRDALIADEAGPRGRGRAFGFHRSMDTTGAVIGPLLGLALYEAVGGRIRVVLALALVPAVVSVALVRLVRERPAADDPRPAHLDDRPGGSLPPAFRRTLVPLGVFALVNSTDALLLQRGHELGLGVPGVIGAYVAYNATYALLGYPAGRVADRVRPRLVVAAGLAVFAVVYIGLGATTRVAAVWVLLPLYGVYAATTDGVSRAWISSLVGDDQRSWALGVHGAVTGFGIVAAGVWSGLAWGEHGRLPLAVSGGVAAVVAAWLVVARGLDPASPS